MTEERVIKRRKRTPTAKQVRFANLLASGKHTLVDAYCLSYATEKMTQTTRRNEASKLASNPTILTMTLTLTLTLTLSTNPYPFHSPGFSVCLGFATPTPLVRVAHDISYT